VGEAINFGLRDWFPYGMDCEMRYRRRGACNILRFQEMLVGEGLALQRKLPGHKAVWQRVSNTCQFSLANLVLCLVHGGVWQF
jgi:hypothetical protein